MKKLFMLFIIACITNIVNAEVIAPIAIGVGNYHWFIAEVVILSLLLGCTTLFIFYDSESMPNDGGLFTFICAIGFVFLFIYHWVAIGFTPILIVYGISAVLCKVSSGFFDEDEDAYGTIIFFLVFIFSASFSTIRLSMMHFTEWMLPIVMFFLPFILIPIWDYYILRGNEEVAKSVTS